MSEFLDDTVLHRDGDSAFSATVTPRWNVGTTPNGGYLMALGLGALGAVTSHKDPLTVTAHFLRPTPPGLLEIHVEKVRTGRSVSTLGASLVAAGAETTRLLAAFGDLDGMEGPSRRSGSPPDVPPPRLLRRAGSGTPPFEVGNRFEYRFPPEAGPGTRGADATLCGWVRFADGGPITTNSIALFADAFPPAVLAWFAVAWVPTIELTVHLRRRPATDWLLGRFTTNHLVDGYLEEDGELWDTDGELVALSRQLARVHLRR